MRHLGRMKFRSLFKRFNSTKEQTYILADSCKFNTNGAVEASIDEAYSRLLAAIIDDYN